MTALAVGMMTTPAQLTAQETAPAAASTTATAQNPAQPQAAKPEGAQKSEADALNVYRHAPVVRTLAKLLNLEPETAARLFEFINFAIIALAIVIPLVRILPRVMRQRSETVRQKIESARKATEEANARLSVIEKQLSGLGAEIAKMRAQVEDESRQDEVRIKSTIEEEKSRIVATAAQEIGVAAAQARRELRHFAADLAIEQAAKQLVLTPASDRALIAEFLGEVESGAENSTVKGGQN
jgi:F-type H+-transporting ATPase subunit b